MKRFPSKSLLLALAIGTNLLAAACGGGSSEGGDGGSAGTSGGGGQGGDPHCHGDSAAWMTMTQTPMACQTNSDCCVVINDCLAEAQVVRAQDFAAAPSTWPYCDDACTKCVSPIIEVGCEDGACVGKVKEGAMPGEPLAGSHCGVDPVVAPAKELHFACGS